MATEGSRAWWRGEGVRIAIVTGVLSLLAASVGAFVGGYIANEGAEKIQQAAADREAARETAAARASARLLIAELEEMDSYAESSLASRMFVYAGSEIHVELRPDDRRLLAARLLPDEWNAVAAALRAATFVERRARQLGVVADLRPGQERTVLRQLHRQSQVSNVRQTVRYFLTELRDQKRAFLAGIAALRPLAEGG